MDNNLLLLEKIKNGDDYAKEEFCKANMKLVHSIALRFQGRGVELNDLIGIASLGLVKAINGFCLDLGLKFSTYAVPVITGEIKRFLRDDGIIHVSRGLKERLRLIKNAEEELRRRFTRDATISEIALECGLSQDDVAEALSSDFMVESIDSKSEENVDIIERIGFSPEEDIINHLTVDELLNKLTDREKQVITLRYLKDRTQAEAARVVGVSQVHISRIEKKAMEKLRDTY
ncbi:MAG: sigma-70 family RNA polymerase sigma factor [Clostridia bacterium]|nr:sigma-70 family RNA polymerase sigma factor [Clostridia bacterium]